MKPKADTTATVEFPEDRDERFGVIVWIVLILSVAGLVIFVGGEGWGQGTTQDSRLGYQTGQVTGLRGHTIQIDKKEYEVDASVTVKDDENRQRELKDVKEGSEIQFHLRRDKIDTIILMLPR